MNNTQIGVISAFITILGWSSAGIFINLLPNLDALLIVAIRLCLSLFFIVPILFLFQKNILKYLNELKSTTTWMLGIILLFCYLLGTLAFQMAPVGEVTILMTISPLFVILYNFLRKQIPKKSETLGVIIAIFGILIMTYNQLMLEESNSSDRLLGNILAMIVSILFTIYSIWNQSLNKKNKAPHSLSIALSTFIMGTLLLIILIGKETEMMSSINFDYSTILFLFGIAILSTAIPTISYTVASQYLNPILTTSILLLQPFIAILFALFFIQEIPDLLVIPGFVFILIGLFLIIKKPKK